MPHEGSVYMSEAPKAYWSPPTCPFVAVVTVSLKGISWLRWSLLFPHQNTPFDWLNTGNQEVSSNIEPRDAFNRGYI